MDVIVYYIVPIVYDGCYSLLNSEVCDGFYSASNFVPYCCFTEYFQMIWISL